MFNFKPYFIFNLLFFANIGLSKAKRCIRMPTNKLPDNVECPEILPVYSGMIAFLKMKDNIRTE